MLKRRTDSLWHQYEQHPMDYSSNREDYADFMKWVRVRQKFRTKWAAAQAASRDTIKDTYERVANCYKRIAHELIDKYWIRQALTEKEYQQWLDRDANSPEKVRAKEISRREDEDLQKGLEDILDIL
jgi:hypothetical protein